MQAVFVAACFQGKNLSLQSNMLNRIKSLNVILQSLFFLCCILLEKMNRQFDLTVFGNVLVLAGIQLMRICAYSL